MAGDSRLQGVGPRLSLLDGDLSAVLQQLRFRGSSIRPAVFVSPGAQGGRAIVENECSPGNSYEVTSDRNFRPGTPVLLGSFAGSGEETIIARAPADKAGSAANPVRISRGTIRRRAPAGPVCPAPISGKTYLAVYRDTGAQILHAWLYADGAFQSTIGTFDFSGEPWSLPAFDLDMTRVTGPERIIFTVDMDGGGDGIATWNPAAGTVGILDTTIEVGNPIVAGGSVYFFDSAQLYKQPVGATGTMDVEAAKLGAPLDPEAGGALLAPTVSLLHTGGESFQSPCFEFNELDGSIVAVPFFGGSWSEGIGRATIAGEDPGVGSNGRSVLGGTHSLRTTYLSTFQHALGLMPAAPGSPEVSMLHPEWSLTLTNVPQLSPSGAEVAIYPASDGETEGILRLVVALPPPSYPSSCPPPIIPVEEGPEGFPEVMLCRD